MYIEDTVSVGQYVVCNVSWIRNHALGGCEVRTVTVVVQNSFVIRRLLTLSEHFMKFNVQWSCV